MKYKLFSEKIKININKKKLLILLTDDNITDGLALSFKSRHVIVGPDNAIKPSSDKTQGDWT